MKWKISQHERRARLERRKKKTRRELLFVPPSGLFPSIASFFSWQLEQRKGPSQGRNFPKSDEPTCIEIPSSGFIST
jgi:hypothetical protein